ncbi:ROK family transcriptional regulator [Kribbella sandramycini]|uniref:Putative NBD/HSP70 family sugar kinase n=1 Tax=Kribbella sandramycini TaxID=60450 RepID=A0A7Y4L2D9_9ACTN|nr:ROK family transcriptional regulator [Kribbella sandramycini]MBB6566294.1 putative NBD/HSP70 family sugar kinase [Kribbella sandramycini]NOL43043.1 ROK family transcriptional regulator [Kribbella sandramycini]
MGSWRPLEGPSQQVALEILLDGPLSRAELSRRVGLSPGSLTRLTKPMVESGLLVEVDVETPDARVGRPSQPLDLDPAAHHFVGIKLTGDTAIGVLTTLRAEVIASVERPLIDHTPSEVATLVLELTDELAAQAPGPLSGLGVTLGGRVANGSEVRWGPYLDWVDVPLGELLAAGTGTPVVVANDLNALTEATHWFGAGRGTDRFALITIGAGVGYGLVVHNRTVESPDTSIGLIGHHPLVPNGPRCDRGHRGCAMSLLTVGAITGRIGAALGRPVDYEECLDLAAKGDPAAQPVISEAGRALGRLIAAAANFTMPELVVLGGEGVRLAEVARAELLAGLHADRHPSGVELPMVLQPADFTEWARGAAVVAIQTFVLGT